MSLARARSGGIRVRREFYPVSYRATGLTGVSRPSGMTTQHEYSPGRSVLFLKLGHRGPDRRSVPEVYGVNA